MRSPRKNIRDREKMLESEKIFLIPIGVHPKSVGTPMDFIGLCWNSVGLRRNRKIVGRDSSFLGVDEL